MCMKFAIIYLFFKVTISNLKSSSTTLHQLIMFKVNIENNTHSIVLDTDSIEVNGEHWDWDLVKVNDNIYHLVKDTRSYVIELVKADRNNKQVQLKINGVLFEADVRDKYDILLDKLGMNQTGNSSHLEVKAPMPGKILEVLVKEGQAVSKGDQLLVLEAMKMENMIKAAGEGVVTSVYVKNGMNVEKNQVLIQF